jgi:inosine/xanthosine triphosphate pyrophosphatase family protein/dephospho-CoA kinase
MKSARLHYGNAFEFDRVLNVFFYTSNTTKLLQARLLFMRHGYELRHFKGKREPYDENYVLGTQTLLSEAIRQVNEEFGVRSIFFVEDTSLRIDALSEESDFPGLAVKEWFQKTSFEELDSAIRQRQNNRRATVYSDIALYVPMLSDPLFFHGETTGQIADSKPAFEESVQYPWLTPDTFNGWFVPDGSHKRLGEMEFEESLEYDFRAKSLRALLVRLQELNAALNLRPNFYTVRRPNFEPGQLSLIPEQARIVLLVIGPKCAGKTTFSDFMASYDSVSVYEASNVLRGIGEEVGVIPSNSDEAYIFLEAKGWEAVADKISRYIEMSETRWNVVTGLRTPEELLLIKERFPDSHIVYIDADSKIRYERHIRRARDQDLKTFAEFQEEDERQRKFGALRVGAEIAETIINNEGSIEQYKRRIDAFLDDLTKGASAVGTPAKDRNFSELHRCLFALHKLGTAASCERIHDETERFGVPVRVYNTNRALKDVPEFALRIEQRDVLLQYAITSRGQDLLALLDLVKGNPAIKQLSLQLPFGQ